VRCGMYGGNVTVKVNARRWQPGRAGACRMVQACVAMAVRLSACGRKGMVVVGAPHPGAGLWERQAGNVVTPAG